MNADIRSVVSISWRSCIELKRGLHELQYVVRGISQDSLPEPLNGGLKVALHSRIDVNIIGSDQSTLL